MIPARLISGLPCSVAAKTLRWVRENEPVLRVLRIAPTRQAYPPTIRGLFLECTTARVDRFPPGCPLDKLATQIANERFGRAVEHISLFLSPTGCVTPAHYDANDVLVFQMRGSKTVAIADQPTVSDPQEDALIENWSPGEAQTFDVRRGDAVLIPRGCAHSTFSTRASLTLGIGLL